MSSPSSIVHSLPPACVPGSAAPLASASAAALLDTLRERDPEIAAHSEAVAGAAVRVAGELSLDPVAVREVQLAALMHDVGKLAVPDEVIGKRGPLSEPEVVTVNRHTELGERMVRAMPGLWQIAPLVRASHERWDGRGYPDGLGGEEIPLPSRIVFACDTYDAMTSNRCYRRALPLSAALEELATAAGTQLCPISTGALIGVVAGPFQRLRERSRRLLPADRH